MSLKNMTKEELELLSYTDLAYMLLKENDKTLNTPTIFKEICNMLELTDDEYTAKIGDFYTSLTTDKRFLLLDSAEWDLREKHCVQFSMDEDEDEEEIDEYDENDEESDNLDDNVDSDMDLSGDTLDDVDDDIEDLSIVGDSDEENED